MPQMVALHLIANCGMLISCLIIMVEYKATVYVFLSIKLFSSSFFIIFTQWIKTQQRLVRHSHKVLL